MSLLALALTAAAGTCTEIDAGDVLMIPPPAVIVLGERPGLAPDGPRAARVVRRLADVAPVTLALEALPPATQPTLDAYAEGGVPTERLADSLEWERRVGLPWRPYSGLVTAALHDVSVVAVGAPPEPPPAGTQVPVASQYVDILADGLGRHAMPLALEADYLQLASWRDHRIAAASLGAWDGRGYLVIVTHRARVEGGFGVSWQAALQSEAPVHAFTLAWGGEPPCYPGDQVWKESLLEKWLGP